MNLTQFLESEEKRFDEECTQSHPGDSGMGGNDPQEPVYEFACTPQYAKQFLTASHNRLLALLREEVEKRFTCVGPTDERHRCSAVHCNNCGECEILFDVLALLTSNT